MNTAPRLLLIEDDPGASASLKRLLLSEGYAVETEMDGAQGFARAQATPFDVVISDWRLPGKTGLDIIRDLHREQPRLPIILITAHGNTDTAIEATKQGAFEYLLKPLDMEELIAVVARAVETRRLMVEPVELGEGASTNDIIVGKSRPMREIYKEIGRVAARPVDVLIRGETGTGKELIARAIYQYSDRMKAPFIAVNCAAIPETLLESELFGHEKGAYTGAAARRIGRFEQAQGGTLFLDEIGDLTLFTQAKLLRVLQERVISRVGGDASIPVDVRVIAATHRDLDAMISEKQFREDLLYRLSQFTIQIPPLRQRVEDIPELLAHFGERFGRDFGISSPAFSVEALELLKGNPWPGNVRQLANVVRQCLLLARGPVAADHVRQVFQKAERPASEPGSNLATLTRAVLAQVRESGSEDAHARMIALVEKELLSAAMESAEGNKTQAARWLGITRWTLREKLAQHGL